MLNTTISTSKHPAQVPEPNLSVKEAVRLISFGTPRTTAAEDFGTLIILKSLFSLLPFNKHNGSLNSCFTYREWWKQ
jgi:hypothetical protein